MNSPKTVRNIYPDVDSILVTYAKKNIRNKLSEILEDKIIFQTYLHQKGGLHELRNVKFKDPIMRGIFTFKQTDETESDIFIKVIGQKDPNFRFCPEKNVLYYPEKYSRGYDNRLTLKDKKTKQLFYEMNIIAFCYFPKEQFRRMIFKKY